MATVSLADQPFESLKNPDRQEQARHDEEANKRLIAQHLKGQQRLAELIDSNTTLPTTLSSITVLNANNTRKGFLANIFNPLLSANHDAPYTLAEALRVVSIGADNLNRFEIFESPISVYFDRPDPTDPSTTPTDLSAFLSVRERPRLVASSGAWAGSNDGSVSFDLLLRNIFGGAESLSASAARGTRTRSSYSATFGTPLFSNPSLRWELSGLASSTSKTWASHEEVVKGGSSKFSWLTGGGHLHEFAYNGVWRQVTGLAGKASPTVRSDAGDSVKSSLSHTWTHDRRNNPLLPTSGYMVKSIAELAGFGPLKGDVAFGKLELESQASVPLPVPFTREDPGISFSAGLRGGLLYPLTLGGSSQFPLPSRINDRFTLGGPTDVRGFRLAGLGPRDGQDSVGGDLYAAGGASIYLPLPRVGKDAPLRFQAFVNGGRLVALQDNRPDGEASSGPMSTHDIQKSVREAFLGLGDGLPSIAAGFGVVYALPVARLELNFSLPLVQRKGEEGRKGLSVGVGLQFL